MTLLRPQRTARSGQNVKRFPGPRETWTGGQGTNWKNLYLQRSLAEMISSCDFTRGKIMNREGPKLGAGLSMRETGKRGRKGVQEKAPIVPGW